MRLLEEPYVTPAGYSDFPFCYIYNGNSLVDATNYMDIQVQLQGDADFILRHIAGVPNLLDTVANGGRWNYKNSGRTYANGNASGGIVAAPNWPVVPEKQYKYSESMWLDLYQVLRAVNACGGTPIHTGFIGFFGVKRFQTQQIQNSAVTPYKYKEFPYRYEYALTIDWPHFAVGTMQSPLHRFQQDIHNCDFELLRMSVSLPGATGALTTQDFALTLYDPFRHALSSAPVPQGYWNAGKPTPSTQGAYQGCFPVPSMVYPVGSSIVFDVQSLLCSTSIPQTYNLSFEGIWRMPC
jgi:hypothetical protein